MCFLPGKSSSSSNSIAELKINWVLNPFLAFLTLQFSGFNFFFFSPSSWVLLSTWWYLLSGLLPHFDYVYLQGILSFFTSPALKEVYVLMASILMTPFGRKALNFACFLGASDCNGKSRELEFSWLCC